MSAPAQLTRAGLLRSAACAALPLALGGVVTRNSLAAPLASGGFVVNVAELKQIRANVFDLRLEFATRAWENTRSRADNWLGYQPTPTRGNADVSDWRETIYRPGLEDGNAAYTLAVAYAVGGRVDHAHRAKDICLAWTRAYNPPPPRWKVGHMVAEPVGPVIKLCMAFELAKSTFSPSEGDEFKRWAALFVRRGMENADFARDEPWVPDVSYGGDVTNPAPYGNSATWQRAMAVWAAAVIGGKTLLSTLEWNFSHRTAKGNDYGWDNLVEGIVIDGAGGEVTEDRYRKSIEYGHFSWGPMVQIADVARRARFRVDLFEYKTKRNGYSVFTPVPYYEQFLRSDSPPPRYDGSDWPKTASRLRNVYELLYRAASDPQLVKMLGRLVNYGGPTRRGDNYDIHILNNAALLGRGPKGPMPAQLTKDNAKKTKDNAKKRTTAGRTV